MTIQKSIFCNSHNSLRFFFFFSWLSYRGWDQRSHVFSPRNGLWKILRMPLRRSFATKLSNWNLLGFKAECLQPQRGLRLLIDFHRPPRNYSALGQSIMWQKNIQINQFFVDTQFCIRFSCFNIFKNKK